MRGRPIYERIDVRYKECQSSRLSVKDRGKSERRREQGSKGGMERVREAGRMSLGREEKRE